MDLRRSLEASLKICSQFHFHRYFISLIQERLGTVENEYHSGFEYNNNINYTLAHEILKKIREALSELISRPHFDEFSKNMDHWTSYSALSSLFNQFLFELQKAGFQYSNSTKDENEQNKDPNRQTHQEGDVDDCQKANQQNSWKMQLEMTEEQGVSREVFEKLDELHETLKQGIKQFGRHKQLKSEISLLFWYSELESIYQSGGIEYHQFEQALLQFASKLEGIVFKTGKIQQLLSEKSITNALQQLQHNHNHNQNNNNDTETKQSIITPQYVEIAMPIIYGNPIIKHKFFIYNENFSLSSKRKSQNLLRDSQPATATSCHSTQFLQFQSQKTLIDKLNSEAQFFGSNNSNMNHNHNNNYSCANQNGICSFKDNFSFFSFHNSIKDSKGVSQSEGDQYEPSLEVSQQYQRQSSQQQDNLQGRTQKQQYYEQGKHQLNIAQQQFQQSQSQQQSINIQSLSQLVLLVKDCQLDLIGIKKGEKIEITQTTVKLGESEPTLLHQAGIVCFGRQALKINAQAGVNNNGKQFMNHNKNNQVQINDVQFKPEVQKVSRSQFKIVWNTMDYYSIICTSPSNPTLLQVTNDTPIELFINLVFRIGEYKFLVKNISNGDQILSSTHFDSDEHSQQHPPLVKFAQTTTFPSGRCIPSEVNFLVISNSNCDTNSNNIQKSNTSSKFGESTIIPKDRLNQNLLLNQSNKPFIELTCIAGDYKKVDGTELGVFRKEVLKDREIITFGRDQRNIFPFTEKEVSRFHCQIVFDKQKRWKLCECYIPDQKHLSSGGTFVQLQNYQQNQHDQLSNPCPLEKGMLIHTEGAVFQVV